MSQRVPALLRSLTWRQVKSPLNFEEPAETRLKSLLNFKEPAEILIDFSHSLTWRQVAVPPGAPQLAPRYSHTAAEHDGTSLLGDTLAE